MCGKVVRRCVGPLELGMQVRRLYVQTVGLYSVSMICLSR